MRILDFLGGNLMSFVEYGILLLAYEYFSNNPELVIFFKKHFKPLCIVRDANAAPLWLVTFIILAMFYICAWLDKQQQKEALITQNLSREEILAMEEEEDIKAALQFEQYKQTLFNRTELAQQIWLTSFN